MCCGNCGCGGNCKCHDDKPLTVEMRLTDLDLKLLEEKAKEYSMSVDDFVNFIVREYLSHR